MPADRPRVLLVDDDVARRLELTARLSTTWDVQPQGHADDTLRVARNSRPELILLVCERKQSDATLRLCRTMRTDVRPQRRVGVIEAGTRTRGAWIAMELWMADGYLALPNPPEVIQAWVDALHRGERPAVAAAQPAGAVDRLKRLLGRG